MPRLQKLADENASLDALSLMRALKKEALMDLGIAAAQGGVAALASSVIYFNWKTREALEQAAGLDLPFDYSTPILGAGLAIAAASSVQSCRAAFQVFRGLKRPAGGGKTAASPSLSP